MDVTTTATITARADQDLLLDLLNTTPVVDGTRTDALADDHDATAWARAHGGSGTPAEVRALRDVRHVLQDVVAGVGDDRDAVARVERVAVRPRVRDGALTWDVAGDPDDALAARALLAWAATTTGQPGRLRPCANADCHLFLLDRSNANTARWCSMATCGNRAKARRHHERSRGA